MNPTRYITSFELMEHVGARRGKNVSLHYFQTKVIAPFRDAGVLVASSSRGYKLPASQQDRYDFVSHSSTIIEPMLSRVKKFRDLIVTTTEGKLGILAADEYKLIRKVVDSVVENSSLFDGSGSGKTSGSGAVLGKAYLRAGFGGLVLCAKKDELTT